MGCGASSTAAYVPAVGDNASPVKPSPPSPSTEPVIPHKQSGQKSPPAEKSPDKPAVAPALRVLESSASTFTAREDVTEGDRAVLPGAGDSGDPNKFPTQGISLWALQEIVREFAEKDEKALVGMTTEQFCRKFVMPEMIDKGPGGQPCSYVQYLADKQIYHDNFGHAVHEATIFVSHAWKNNFLDLVHSLVEKMAPLSESQAGEWLWIDVFCVNQHRVPPNIPLWLNSLRDTIKTVGRLVVVMEPWVVNQPAAPAPPPDGQAPDYPVQPPLKRMWCLWELLCVAAHDGDLDMITGASFDDNALIAALTEDFDKVKASFVQIDFEAAETSKREDKPVIMGAMEKLRIEMNWGDGYAVVARKVSKMLQDWIDACGDLAPLRLENASVPGKDGKRKLLQRVGTLLHRAQRLERQVKVFRSVLEYWEDRVRRTDRNFDNVVFAKQKLATALTHLCQGPKGTAEAVAEARALFAAVVSKLGSTRGEDSPDYLLAMNSQAVLLMVDSQSYNGGIEALNTAESLLTRVTADWKRFFPGRNAELCSALHNLGTCLAMHTDDAVHEERLRRAVKVLHEAQAAAKCAYGANQHHPMLVEIMCSLADALNSVGDFEQAEHMYKMLIPRLRVYYGALNVRTCTMQFNLAQIQANRGADDEALRNYDAASRGFTATYDDLQGDNNRKNEAQSFLAVLSLAKSKAVEIFHKTIVRGCKDKEERRLALLEIQRDFFVAWREAHRDGDLRVQEGQGSGEDAEGKQGGELWTGFARESKKHAIGARSTSIEAERLKLLGASAKHAAGDGAAPGAVNEESDEDDGGARKSSPVVALRRRSSGGHRVHFEEEAKEAEGALSPGSKHGGSGDDAAADADDGAAGGATEEAPAAAGAAASASDVGEAEHGSPAEAGEPAEDAGDAPTEAGEGDGGEKADGDAA